jgi:hypothetical protein
MFTRNTSATSVSYKFALIVAAVVILVGCVLVISGCAFEAQSQFDLLRTSGPAALDAYLAKVSTHQLSFTEFMVDSVTGHGYARGAFLQGVGFWFVFFLAPTLAALLSVARWFADRNQMSNPSLSLAAVH